MTTDTPKITALRSPDTPKITALRSLRASIVTTAATIRSTRVLAREHFRVASTCRAAGDEPGALRAREEGHAARHRADDLGFQVRQHQLARAFLRGRPYAAMEGTRKRAPAPKAEHILDVIRDVAPIVSKAALDLIEAWLVAPLPEGQRATQEPPTRRLGTPPVLAASEPSPAPAEAG